MKKSLILFAAVTLLIMVGVVGILWYDTPTHLLENVTAGDVAEITVFDGNTGEGFEITDPEVIEKIIANISGATLKREKISIGYTGYSFRMQFYTPTGRRIAYFIINGKGTIRKDPFFYFDAAESLCYDYLGELESAAIRE